MTPATGPVLRCAPALRPRPSAPPAPRAAYYEEAEVCSRVIYELEYRKPVLYVIPIKSILSRTQRAQIGRSGSVHAPYAADLVRSRTQVDWIRRAVVACPSRMERQPHTLQTWTGAGPETELSSQDRACA